MILLFGSKAKTHSSQKNSNIKNHPVENSGILAFNSRGRRGLLDANEYDTYMFSRQAEIDYSQYENDANNLISSVGFLSEFSDALSILDSDSYSYCGDYTGAESYCSSSCSDSCGSFSSVC